MLTFFIYLVGTLLVLVCLLIVLLVLMQRPKQEGLGAAFGAGVTDQIWGSQTTNVLQKGTVYLGILFFVLSLTLCVLEARKSRQFAGMNVPASTPAAVTPESPSTPAGTTSTPFELPPATPAPAPSPEPAPAEETAPAPAAAEGQAPAAPAEIPAASPDASAAETPAAPPVEPAAPASETPAAPPVEAPVPAPATPAETPAK